MIIQCNQGYGIIADKDTIGIIKLRNSGSKPIAFCGIKLSGYEYQVKPEKATGKKHAIGLSYNGTPWVTDQN